MERKRARSRSRGGALNPIFNVLSLIFLLLSCVSLLCVASVFAVPGLLPAQFQPPTSIALIARPTLIPRTLVPDIPTFPATWTPTDTPTVTPTQPTSTPSPSPTNTEPGPTRTPSDTPTFTLTPTRPGPTATPTNTRSPNPWTLQAGSPTYLQNGINTAGCNWMGITGQAFGLDGRPVLNFYVHLEGGGLLVDAPTGSQPSVGPGGYIIVLGDHPVETTETYKLQLRNASGQPLSDNYIIPTRGDCRQNQILVNFIQNH